MRYISKKTVREMLPRVGEERMEIMTMFTTNPLNDRKPQPCVVVEVNPRGLWYRVKFKNGFSECYKMPEDQLGPNGGIRV